jgi:hypothetical protein
MQHRIFITKQNRNHHEFGSHIRSPHSLATTMPPKSNNEKKAASLAAGKAPKKT